MIGELVEVESWVVERRFWWEGVMDRRWCRGGGVDDFVARLVLFLLLFFDSFLGFFEVFAEFGGVTGVHAVEVAIVFVVLGAMFGVVLVRRFLVGTMVLVGRNVGYLAMGGLAAIVASATVVPIIAVGIGTMISIGATSVAEVGLIITIVVLG